MGIILLLLFAGLILIGLTGHGADSRDPDYSLWPLGRARDRSRLPKRPSIT